MRDLLDEITTWFDQDRPFGLATVVRTFRSAPREPGAAMAVGPDGSVIGSVSGGCVEATVYEAAQDVVTTGEPRLETYGVSDADAFEVGLSCGGEIGVFVEPIDRTTLPQLPDLVKTIKAADPVALATVVAGPGRLGAHLSVWPDHVAGTLGSERLDAAVADDARGMLEQGLSGERRYGAGGERRPDELTVFVASYAPPPRMYVFGAIDFATAVCRIGAFLGYRVTVCDARPLFATARRFPEAAEVVVAWPHTFLESAPVDARTVICVLTHDPKFDVPLLEVAVRRPAAYIGAMGSRRTHDQRLALLSAAGISAEQIARISAPIGLDLGARTPEETAVSIAAELIALRWGGSGARLMITDGPIHHPRTQHR